MEGCTVVDRDWRIRYLNDTAVRHARQSREHLLGRTIMECYPGIEATPLFAALRRCMDKGTGERIDEELVHPDGSSAWLELRIQTQPGGLSILSIDVSERRLAERSLRERDEQLDMALRGGGLGTASSSPNECRP
jgi:PAS domain S-box-containing protein